MLQETCDVFLQGHQNDIKGSKLPFKVDALGFFLYLSSQR